MLRLMECEFLKLKRRPLVFISLVLSVFMPLAYVFFLSDVNTDVDAVNGVMSSLFQLSAYLLLMPLLVILASSLLFQELDHDTLKILQPYPWTGRSWCFPKCWSCCCLPLASWRREAW